MITDKIILFEYDIPIDRTDLINQEAGIWQWIITNTLVNVEDDNSVTGYYDYQQSIRYMIRSLKVNKINYSKVDSLSDCRSTDSSFYYDYATTKLYIHFADFEPPLDKEIFFGAALGYAIQNNTGTYYFNDFYYEPRALFIGSLKKQIDPLFWGLLKFDKMTAKFINNDGHFDDWRSRNLFGQACRILYGDVSDTYDNLDILWQGYIEDDNMTFENFSLTCQDHRKKLTQSCARNVLTSALYPSISDDNKDKVKPLCYGTIRNGTCICIDEAAGTPFVFVFCDTEFNAADSVSAVYMDGVDITSDVTIDLDAGTITISAGDVATIADNLTNITADFVATDFSNGVEVIKDLMYRYDGKTFIASFWDTAEVNAAELLARDVSVYVDSATKKLSDVLTQICFDIDARFFIKNNGKYTVKIYSESQIPVTTILADEWLDYPEITNNGSEFLSSCIVEYDVNRDGDTRRKYQNDVYKDTVFDNYKSFRVETFKTDLPTLTDAQEKSETIMNISKSVSDIISRKIGERGFSLEPADFVIASPHTRYSEAEDFNVYEVMSVERDFETKTTGLQLRYVKEYTGTNYDYNLLIDTDGNFIVDQLDNMILTKEEI